MNYYGKKVDPRIRIHVKMRWIRNAEFTNDTLMMLHHEICKCNFPMTPHVRR